MPEYYIALLSILLYGVILGAALKHRDLFNLRRWPKHPTLFMVWALWLVFLFVLAPLTYHKGDMGIWRTSIQSLLSGQPLPENYVYLPIYAELLSAVVWPFHMIGLDSPLLIVYVVNGFVILSYAYCAKLMSEFVPSQSELAPLGIVLAPVTIFYLFLGTNHVVMFLFLLIALILIRKERWFWAGFFAFLSCYKFLLVPTLFVLVLIILLRYDLKGTVLFCLGGLVSLVPSLVYYVYDFEPLINIVRNQANIGGHSHHVEWFHSLFPVAMLIDGFEAWYVGKKIWFYAAILGVPLSLLLLRFKRVNTLQCLALSYAFVAVFALEPFRMEPLVGLLWLDAVFRHSLRMQTAVFASLFIHALAWYDLAYSRFLSFDPAAPLHLWQARGLYLGVAVIIAFVIALFEKDKRDLMFPKG